jgi:hypothetical protein
MVPELRPRGIGEMLDAAVALYRVRFRRLVLTSLAVVFPVQALITLLLISATSDQVDTTQSTNTQLGTLWFALLLYTIVGLIVTALVARPIADAYVGVEHAHANVPKRSPFALLLLIAIVSVVAAIGLVFCYIPGLLVLGLWAIAIPAMRLEGTGPFRSMGRSQQLARGHYLSTVGLISSALLLWFVLQQGIALGANQWINHGATRTSALIAQGSGDVFATALTMPLIATAIVVCYFDGRIRNEAFDIQLQMVQPADELAPAQ